MQSLIKNVFYLSILLFLVEDTVIILSDLRLGCIWLPTCRSNIDGYSGANLSISISGIRIITRLIEMGIFLFAN